MNVALILSGGTGTRLGADIPKQYIEVCQRPIIAYAVDVFERCSSIDAIVIAAVNEWHDFILDKCCTEKLRCFSVPGVTRQLSIYNGLCTIKDFAADDDVVIIHDAARPCVTERMIVDCIDGAIRHDGSLPVLSMKDTVYLSENGSSVTSLLQREKLFAGQAPEAFKFGKYLAANEALIPDKIFMINGSTEPAIIAGMDVAMISGDEGNFKITTKNDLIRFEEIMRKNR